METASESWNVPNLILKSLITTSTTVSTATGESWNIPSRMLNAIKSPSDTSFNNFEQKFIQPIKALSKFLNLDSKSLVKPIVQAIDKCFFEHEGRFHFDKGAILTSGLFLFFTMLLSLMILSYGTFKYRTLKRKTNLNQTPINFASKSTTKSSPLLGNQHNSFVQ